MAKRKNAVKSGLNQLRQALLQAKTAILNFSPEHILAVSYDPSSKATIVKDIPANLESQFTLGEGGGGSLDLHPKLTMNVTVQGNSAWMVNNALMIKDYWAVIQGNNFVTDVEYLDADSIVNFNNGDTKVVTCVLPLDMLTLGVYHLIPERGFLQTFAFSNCVNCNGNDQRGTLVITDYTQDASADVTLTFSDDE